jgi:hypothetical protein
MLRISSPHAEIIKPGASISWIISTIEIDVSMAENLSCWIALKIGKERD